MIDLILATDMSRHTEIMEKFNSLLTQGFDYNSDEHRRMVKREGGRMEGWERGGGGG